MKTLAIDNGAPPIRSGKDRYCIVCGKKVCSYKDGDLKNVTCYAHDHLQPWNYTYIMGCYEHWRQDRQIDGWNDRPVGRPKGT